MKNLFISCPMKGRSNEAIKQSIEKMHKIAEIIFDEKLEVINSYIEGELDTKNQTIFCLGRSIQMMAEADYFVGIYESYEYTGCDIERRVAVDHQIPYFLISASYIMPEEQECNPVEDE